MLSKGDSMEIRKKRYRITIERQEDSSFSATLFSPSGGAFFTMPLGMMLELNESQIPCIFTECSEKDGQLLFTGSLPECGILSKACLRISFGDDEIVTSFTMEAAKKIKIASVEQFRNGRKGLYMVDCVNYFAPQPRNFQGVNRAFYKCFCDCSLDGYFTPAPLNFSIGNANGWVSFGLLRLPDSDEYCMTPQLGILLEKPEGNIILKPGETYHAPDLLLTFPEDEWAGEVLFRKKLLEKGLIHDMVPEKKNFPAWWQRPTVCTYGDQMLDLQYNWYTDDDWGCQGFNLEWLSAWLDDSERFLGNNEFTIIVDAFWQYAWSAEPKADMSRFPNFRAFIDKCHKRGHKVLLWTPPFTDARDNGFVPLSEKFGVLTEKCSTGLSKDRYYIDFTSDNAEAYLNAVARGFFGNGEGELNCDGLKMDFLASFMPVKDGIHAHPEKGIGMKGIYRFYEMFDRAARKVKEDVFLDGSSCDPRIDAVLHINRLHDIQQVYEERELRARASCLAAPGMIMDSDGAIMLSTWVKETYLAATLYSTPSLYYVKKFHDGLSLPIKEMKALGRLLSLSSRKIYGVVSFISPGNWRLLNGNRIVGATFNGESLVICDTDQKHLHVFTWKDGKAEIPLLDMLPSTAVLPEGLSVTDGVLCGNFTAGTVLTLEI